MDTDIDDLSTEAHFVQSLQLHRRRCTGQETPLVFEGDKIKYLDTLLTPELQHNYNIKFASITD
jgi:hypothetical protein